MEHEGDGEYKSEREYNDTTRVQTRLLWSYSPTL